MDGLVGGAVAGWRALDRCGHWRHRRGTLHCDPQSSGTEPYGHGRHAGTPYARTTGPYRWVRRPFYFAAALAVVANALTAANSFIGATSAAAVVLLLIRSTTEEYHLEKRFGPEYTRYVRRTGRFLPRLRTPASSSQ